MRVILQAPPSPQEWVLAFLKHLHQTDYAQSTIHSYQKDLRRFLAFYQQAYPRETTLDNLQSACLVHFRQNMVHQDKLAIATVNRRLEALRRFCRFCHDNGWLTQNPAACVKSMRISKQSKPRGLTVQQTHALIQATMPLERRLGVRDHALLHLLLQTGLRIGEAAALLIQDLVIYDRSGWVRVRDGKGHRQRAVPLNATARGALRRYLATRGDTRGDKPVFVSERGAPLSVRGMQIVMGNLARRAGLKREFSAHVLRHTFALNYLRDNPGKLADLSHLMGHESVNTTAVYARSSEQDMADDLERSQFNVEAGLVGA
ncbi:MAG: tyrosine-type recombinase/integrase [Myxococcota bacterium]